MVRLSKAISSGPSGGRPSTISNGFSSSTTPQFVPIVGNPNVGLPYGLPSGPIGRANPCR